MTALRGRYYFFSYYRLGIETVLCLSGFMRVTPLGNSPSRLSPAVLCWPCALTSRVGIQHFPGSLWPRRGSGPLPDLVQDKLCGWRKDTRERTWDTKNESEIQQSEDLTWIPFLLTFPDSLLGHPLVKRNSHPLSIGVLLATQNLRLGQQLARHRAKKIHLSYLATCIPSPESVPALELNSSQGSWGVKGGSFPSGDTLTSMRPIR